MGVVPCLDEGRDQLNSRFPTRDKTSDGAWGDKAHAITASSHNGDKSGNPEWRDGDRKDEVRARDFDADLRDPDYKMEDVVQLWVKLARSGALWWVRYIIFNGRIWHKKDGFKTREYTGKNKHNLHAHVNSDFDQKADEVTGTNWGLSALKKKVSPNPKPPASPRPTAETLEKGDRGQAVIHLQDFFRRVFPSYRLSVSVKRGRVISVDGDFGDQTQAWVKEFQKRTRLKQDGIVGPATRAKLRSFGYQF